MPRDRPREEAGGWVVMSGTGRHPGSACVVYANLTRQSALLEEGGGLDTTEVIERLQEGLPKSALARVRALIGVTNEQLSLLINVATRTIARRQRLAADESERLFRVARVFHRAMEVLGDRASAQHWFETPKPALAGRTPMELVRSELGATEVERLLSQIEHGVYA